MKIGIMGGTFDPIHNGHLMLGACAYDKFNLDSVWFLPNGNPPHKKEETNTKDRLEMVRLAIEKDERFVLNTYEAKQSGKCYSYETLESFHRQYPEYEFYFIVGADSLFSIESWKEPAKVMKACTLLAACRDDKNPQDMQEQIAYLTEKYDADIQLMNTPHMDISSSDIREMTSMGMNIGSMVPEEVASYIQKHHLYKDVSVS